MAIALDVVLFTLAFSSADSIVEACFWKPWYVLMHLFMLCSVLVLFCPPALAVEDYFNINITPSRPTSGRANASRTAPRRVKVSVPEWFASYDQLSHKLEPSELEAIILGRELTDAKHIMEWKSVAAKTAKNYRVLARVMTATALPAGYGELENFRELKAQWYIDAAKIFEAWLTPRPDIETIEDLDEVLDRLEQRTKSLGQTYAQLDNLEASLRDKYNLRRNIYKDPFERYVSSVKYPEIK